MAVAAIAAVPPAIAYAGGTAGLDTGVELAAEAFAWAKAHVSGILTAAYERAPVLVSVLAALLIIPMMALTALMAHGLQLNMRQGRGRGPAPQPNSTFKATMTADTGVPPWPAAAWLDIAGQTKSPLPRVQGLVRIGRHDDNDIRLPHTTVHRHHAIIHRTPEAAFIIMDLSGHDGNGVVVNGQRLAEARLKPGDTIQLGEISMRFECAPL